MGTADRVSCACCARRFAPERLSVHQRVCTSSRLGFRPTVTSFGGAPSVAARWPEQGAEGYEPSPEERSPCDYCGRSFALSRLASHRTMCAPSSLVSFRAVVEALDAEEGVGHLAASKLPEEEEGAAACAAEYVPCERCERRFAPDRISAHRRVCAPSDRGFSAKAASRGAAAAAAPLAGEAPPAADDALEHSNAYATDADGDPVPCDFCGRSFAPSRLQRHRDGCLNRSLPGFRAQVGALEEEARKYEVARHAQQQVEAAELRVCAGAKREEELQGALVQATRKIGLAEAAAKSMEAAHDVMADDAAEAKQKLAAALARGGELEEGLAKAIRKGETAEAAAKSMEAAHDVMAEDAAEAKQKLAAALARCRELDEGLAKATRKGDTAEAAAKSMEAAHDVMADDAAEAKQKLVVVLARGRELEEGLAKAIRKGETAEAAAKSMEAAHDVMADDAAEAKQKLAVALARCRELEEGLAKAIRKGEMAEAAVKSMEAAHDVMAESAAEAKAQLKVLKLELEKAIADRKGS